MARFLTQLLVLGGITAITTLACSSGSDCDFGLCAGTPVGSVVGPDGSTSTPPAPTPPGCDVTADPTSAAATPCVDNVFALFVDGQAGAGGDGSKGKPVAKIGDALAMVGASGKHRIYVCGSQSFDEALVVSTANQASIHGGFACGTWTPTGERPTIAPLDPRAGIPLRIDGVRSQASSTGEIAPMVLSDLLLVGADAGSLQDGTSSIALFANGSNLRLQRVDLTANNGALGARGMNGATGKVSSVKINNADQTVKGDASDLIGTSASAGTVAPSKACVCDSTPAVSSIGGAGGTNGTAGREGTFSPASGAPAAGGEGGGPCGSGSPGRAGQAATNADPVTVRGSIGNDGWRPEAGKPGKTNGGPGGGGGGGGALPFDGTNFTTGGGGGCGGCGGTASGGGGGGGASIAIVAVDTTISFLSSVVVARAGGVGGDGGTPGQGVTGGPGGGPYNNTGCIGGTGGKGANGGIGGGGAGGVSVGLLYRGGSHDLLAEAVTVPTGVASGGKGIAGPDGFAAKIATVDDVNKL